MFFFLREAQPGASAYILHQSGPKAKNIFAADLSWLKETAVA